MSHPSRVRGLKLVIAVRRLRYTASHPSRVRGLKLAGGLLFASVAWAVAPLAGAWIET